MLTIEHNGTITNFMRDGQLVGQIASGSGDAYFGLCDADEKFKIVRLTGDELDVFTDGLVDHWLKNHMNPVGLFDQDVEYIPLEDWVHAGDDDEPAEGTVRVTVVEDPDGTTVTTVDLPLERVLEKIGFDLS